MLISINLIYSNHTLSGLVLGPKANVKGRGETGLFLSLQLDYDRPPLRVAACFEGKDHGKNVI